MYTIVYLEFKVTSSATPAVFGRPPEQGRAYLHSSRPALNSHLRHDLISYGTFDFISGKKKKNHPKRLCTTPDLATSHLVHFVTRNKKFYDASALYKFHMIKYTYGQIKQKS
ncbi:hypothetical protein EVAR_49642_1 [Eumeta japonica]|uniref:Uncharacterized protein n=1 Tax=Eumeta variegata TaxID=151549 RepID=A0A4C1YC85_EUMVA|nr:hypothetical protein EVAR_49642_1 [Eumeta japonica]